MSDSIKDTVPKVLKTLWDLETELRGAAQNGVILRREEASKHLAEARRHLDELLGLARSPETTTETTNPAESSTANSSDNRI